MKLEDQVVSLEYAKRLTGLGLKNKSLFYWRANYSRNIFELVYMPDEDASPYLPAYTVAELGEMLPKDNIQIEVPITQWVTRYITTDGYVSSASDKLEANSRAKLLIYLIENNLINT